MTGEMIIWISFALNVVVIADAIILRLSMRRERIERGDAA